MDEAAPRAAPRLAMRKSLNDDTPDWAAELAELCERYRLDRIRQPAGSATPVAVTWMTDDGPVTEARATGRELVLYLRGEVQAPVMEREAFGEVTVDMVRATFDHWRVFDENGRWWALRAGMAGGSGPASLIRPVVCAMTLQGLAEQLSLQEWLRRMTAEELAAVWHDGIGAVAR
jgi:hypothetical protein